MRQRHHLDLHHRVPATPGRVVWSLLHGVASIGEPSDDAVYVARRVDFEAEGDRGRDAGDQSAAARAMKWASRSPVQRAAPRLLTRW